MPEPESDPGFTFVDRRRRADDPGPSRENLPSPSIPSPPVDEQGGSARDHPQADLASLCVMLYSDALVHLGQLPDPLTNQPRPDLNQARFTIDLLAMIKEKSEGNRTPEESAILEEMLAALRMGFVHASRLA